MPIPPSRFSPTNAAYGSKSVTSISFQGTGREGSSDGIAFILSIAGQADDRRTLRGARSEWPPDGPGRPQSQRFRRLQLTMRIPGPIASRERGFTMIEVLVSLLILVFGLLGLIGLQARTQVATFESYQRGQALILVQDMADRIATNRATAGCYTTTTPLGTGFSGAPTCGAATGTAATRALADADLQAWNDALQGAAETRWHQQSRRPPRRARLHNLYRGDEQLQGLPLPGRAWRRPWRPPRATPRPPAAPPCTELKRSGAKSASRSGLRY
jgi:type IV pilus modification protein PilV